MQQGPSKKFLIRGGIATSILVIILVSQTSWFHSLFSKKEAVKKLPDITVGELVGNDSNGNEIPDWEERLWGLDPTVAFTNGVSNKTIIEDKKRSLGLTPTTDTTTQTDLLAHDLYALTTALNQSENVDQDTLQAVGQNLASSVPIQTYKNTYSASDIKTVPTTSSSLRSYQNAIKKTTDAFRTDAPGFELVITALETGDYSELPKLATAADQYTAIASGLKKIAVPVGVAQYHLDIINGFSGMAKSFVYLEQLDVDSLYSISGIALYKASLLLYNNAITNLNQYFVRYGILSE